MTRSLFQPIQIGAVTLRNRVLMSALTRNRALPTNVPNELMVEYYRQRAESAGLIVSEGILICQQGTEWPHAPGIWNQQQINGWKNITDAIHEAGSHCFAQIWHLGRASHPDTPEQIASGQPVYAPSAIPARGGKFRFLPGVPGYVTPTEIDNPMRLVALHRQAAINAKEAGFDGIEVHGAGGYLIHQFLDSGSNIRTDSWGGSFENRSRFGLEVLRVVIDVWGADRVGIKLDPTGGYNDVGMPLEETLETYNYFIAQVDQLGLAYIAIQRYSEFNDPIHLQNMDIRLKVESRSQQIPVPKALRADCSECFHCWEMLSTAFGPLAKNTGFADVIEGKRRAVQHDVVAAYSHLIKKSTLLSNGNFTPEEAAQYVSEGKISGVFWGRLWISHPDFAKRIRYGKPVDTPVDMQTVYGNTDGMTLSDQRLRWFEE